MVSMSKGQTEDYCVHQLENCLEETVSSVALVRLTCQTDRWTYEVGQSYQNNNHHLLDVSKPCNAWLDGVYLVLHFPMYLDGEHHVSDPSFVWLGVSMCQSQILLQLFQHSCSPQNNWSLEKDLVPLKGRTSDALVVFPLCPRPSLQLFLFVY